MDIGETGATANFQSKIFEVAHFCEREKVEKKDVEEAELDPPQDRFRRRGADPGSQSRQVDVEKETENDGENGGNASSTGFPEGDSSLRQEMIPAPDSPASSAKLPFPHVPSGRTLHLQPSFDKACKSPQAPGRMGARMMNCRRVRYTISVHTKVLEQRN